MTVEVHEFSHGHILFPARVFQTPTFPNIDHQFGGTRSDQDAVVSLVPRSTVLFQANSVPSLKLTVTSELMKKQTNSQSTMSYAVC